ncbi:hypothetical protein E2C01_037852 [Portunus trituberculatus]|uniref:Uncharacterized protein n=1 Tax=Portunus trituberculatus TaxID=210409 RepID=A0A5B7FF59_PORTR|nr:hypothetical protein [Portunus trituberculatus]
MTTGPLCAIGRIASGASDNKFSGKHVEVTVAGRWRGGSAVVVLKVVVFRRPTQQLEGGRGGRPVLLKSLPDRHQNVTQILFRPYEGTAHF